MTDTNNLYGLHEFLAGCRDHDLHPVIGAEVSDPVTRETLTCLVQNQQGYSNLCTLLSRRHLDPDFSLTTPPASLSKGLLILCNNPTHLFLYNEHGFEVAADLGHKPTHKARELRAQANRHSLPALCTPNSSLGTPDDRSLHFLLQAISRNTSLSKIDRANPPEHIATAAEYRRRFAVWPDAIKNSGLIEEKCSGFRPDFSIVMPPWESDKQNPTSILRKQAYKGAIRRYGEDLGEQVVERLEHELGVIDSMGFSSYFLVVRDIVHPKREDGKRIKRRICGRGSGAASLVAYCLEITNVCPVKHNLYFERFLNPGRKDPPDIDIDFGWDERDDVLTEILEKYKNHAAMVCNHVCFKPRMAIRETAKAFGLPGYEISQLTKKIPWFYHNDENSFEEQVTRLPSLRGIELAPPWPEIFKMSQQLLGLVRYLSVHPGGVIITPKPIEQYAPVEKATKGVPIIQWEKDGAEEAGLVKIDILGNRSLGVIRDAIKNIRENGNDFSEKNWEPEDDQRTKRFVARGKTMGCFYIESPAMRLLQRKANSGDFEQLVLQSSIIRPAANEFVREYVRRLKGGSWNPLHPLLKDVLDETFGLMVYQEDVSKVAVSIAGFSHVKADGLRKVLSKKDREKRLRDYNKEFREGCHENGINPETTEKIWQMMMSFDGYSFCKPHSASYAKVSYQAAYLKAHYPAEFMAAVISNQGGYYSTFSYVSEAKRLGLNILRPDIHKSCYKWFGSNRSLRVGLLSIKGLSQITAGRIISKRIKQSFQNMADFLHRVQPTEDEARQLIHAGVLDSLKQKKNRTELLWDLACYKRIVSLKAGSTLFPPTLPKSPKLQSPHPLTLLRHEYSALGFLCTSHPITFVNQQHHHLIKGCELSKHKGKVVSFAGWLITGKLVSTRTGEAMEFLTFEDETATVEATFFPKTYRRYAHVLCPSRGYLLTGLVEEDYGATTLTVREVKQLNRQKSVS